MAATRKIMRKIDTMRELHKALGGVDAIAKSLGSCRSSIAMWTSYKAVSGGHRLTVFSSLKARGYRPSDINPRLFNYDTWDEMIMPHLKARRTTPLKRAA